MVATTDFYSSAQWRRVRESVLSLYGATCMNCGKTPEETGKSAHVDHIRPRSRFPELELDITNLQVLCEDCNCAMKGTHVVDYRTNEQIRLIEKYSGRNVVPQSKPQKKQKQTPEEKDYTCRRALSSLRGLTNKRTQKRLEHLVKMFGEERVREQLKYI